MQGYFTTKGLALSAKLAAGSVLTISRVVAGSGQTQTTASALSGPCQTLAVNSPTRSGDTAVIPATLEAASASGSYTLTELGVYANDPDEGEILYKLYKLSKPVDIAAGSSMVLRFYLEETVSQELDVAVTCSPAGLVTEEAFAPVRDKANGVKEEAVTYQLEAADLQAKLDALPHCLTRDVTLSVNGTVSQNITVRDFYGDGQLVIRGTSKEEFSVTGQVWLTNCRCRVTLGCAALLANAEESRPDILKIENCPDVELFNLDVSDGAKAKRGVAIYKSGVVMASVSISGCLAAVIVYFGGYAVIRPADSYDAPSYSDNKIGAYIYHGGSVYLCGSIPSMLGGASHTNSGGLIVSSSGTLL